MLHIESIRLNDCFHAKGQPSTIKQTLLSWFLMIDQLVVYLKSSIYCPTITHIQTIKKLLVGYWFSARYKRLNQTSDSADFPQSQPLANQQTNN